MTKASSFSPFLEFSQNLIENLPSVTGGVRGLSSGRPFLFGVKLSSDLYFYYVILIISLVGIWCAHSLLKSPTGRAFNAIRNSEAAAQTLAIPLARTKLVAFVISSFYAGIGGGLYATLVEFIDPLEFNLLTSVRHIIFITVGGLGSVTGSIIGAIAFTVLPELLRGSKEYNEFVFGGFCFYAYFHADRHCWARARAQALPVTIKTAHCNRAWGPH